MPTQATISVAATPPAAETRRWSGLGVAAVWFAIACAGHAVLVRSGVAADTAWFSLAGAAFLLVTAISHCVLCRQHTASPLVPLLLSMTIRLAGTFLILGTLLAFSPLSRPEAVSNVLFWYITFTAADLVGVIRTR